MKTIVSALIALSLLAGVAGSTNALDVTKFWDEHLTSGERQSSDLIHHCISVRGHPLRRNASLLTPNPRNHSKRGPQHNVCVICP